MDSKDGDDAKKKAETTPVKMDINRYLQQRDYGKSISAMLRVLFKGQLATEPEWDEKTQRVMNHKVE